MRQLLMVTLLLLTIISLYIEIMLPRDGVYEQLEDSKAQTTIYIRELDA